MRTIDYSPTAKKEIKKLRGNPKFDQKLFVQLLNMIAAGEPIPPQYNDHKMSKTSRPEYMGCRDFHLKGNLCVVYNLTDDEVYVKRIGSHQDLNLTESINRRIHLRADRYIDWK